MPNPHFDIKITQRSRNQSAVAGAAYQSGENLFSEYDQKQKNYTNKGGIVYKEIMLPENAPPEFSDRETLWNSVEAVEKQWNSQLARRFVLALPREVPMEMYPQMIRDYCQKYFVKQGMCCDFAIHDPDPPGHNPHCHIMLTLRALDENGKWLPKSRKVYDLDENGERIQLPSGRWKSHKVDTVDWNEQWHCEQWRRAWEDVQNRYLAMAGSPERVDLRSYARQRIDQVPTVHMGPSVSALENKGVSTNIGNLNQDIQKHNHLMAEIRKAIHALTNWIAELSEKRKQILKALQERKEPTLIELLSDYLDVRAEERNAWSSKARLKGAVADYDKVRNVIDYLSQNNLQTVDDLKMLIDEKRDRIGEIQAELNGGTPELRTVEKILKSYKTYEKLLPVNKEYLKKNFRFTKEKFYSEHKEEIDEFRKSYRYLMKHGGEKQGNRLIVDVPYYQKQLKWRTELDQKNRTELSGLYEDLEMLKTVRYYVSKVQPEPEEIVEIVKSDPEKKASVRERLKENRQRIDEAQKKKKQKSRGPEL